MRKSLIALGFMSACVAPAFADDGTQSFEFPAYKIEMTLTDTTSGCVLTNAQLNNTSERVLKPVEADLHASDGRQTTTLVVKFPSTQPRSGVAVGQNGVIGPSACDAYTIQVEGTAA